MDNKLNDILKKIYIDEDYGYFKDRCKNKIELSKELYKRIEVYINDIVEENIDNAPSQKWYFKYANYENGIFKVSYKTFLQISKIAPVFYIHHEFEIENFDENKMDPVLDGFGQQPYTKGQSNVYEIIKEILSSEGYMELSISEINEILLYKDNNSMNLMSGEKFSVEELVFYDMLDIVD